ncbi:DEAD/DEAH box helicase [Shewanella xiamenensis]|uniref:DEAD/DEAH box helicase n=1 Tax=Shewanella xiamenensis TaxID=332186 RepID=UPI00155925B1|nr:AAA domain-containing protein [Shewanella xiamenensis]
MNLFEFPYFQTDLIRVSSPWFEQFDKAHWDKFSSVTIREHGDNFLLINDEKQFAEVYLKALPEQAAKLTLATVAKFEPDTLYLACLPIQDSVEIDEVWNLGADEQIIEQVRAKATNTLSPVEDVLKWLQGEFVCDNQGGGCFAQMYRNDNSVQTGSQSRFTLIGRRWLIDMVQRSKGAWFIERLRPLSQQQSNGILWLQADVQFVDASSASLLASKDAQQQISAIIDSNQSYINLWRKYNQLEQKKAETEAIAQGYIRYRSYESVGQETVRWQFELDLDMQEKLPDFVAGLLSNSENLLEADKNLPEWFTQDELSKLVSVQDKARRFAGKFIKASKNSLTLEPDLGKKTISPPKQGYLFLSLAGTMASLQRRQKAWELISQGQNPMPQLRYLLEEREVPRIRRRNLEALSPAARMMFKGQPTDRQRQALHAALNTPDICLIQGPPGTGKTQVIAALLKRLAEVSDSEQVQHQTLVSSYQHDAVENALERSEVFGLPAPKIGGRRNRDAQRIDPVSAWSEERAVQIEQKLSSLKAQDPVWQAWKSVQQSLTKAMVSRLLPQELQEHLRDVRNHLNALAEISQLSPSAMLLCDLDDLIKQKFVINESLTSSERKQIIASIRALRVTETAFSDDGIDRVQDLLTSAYIGKIELKAAALELLEQASNWQMPSNCSDLPKLRALKDKLLDRLFVDSRSICQRKMADNSITELLCQIRDELAGKFEATRYGVTTVLDDYANALRYQPAAVRNATAEYSAVLGATCQQSASNSMADLKSIENRSSVVFNTIIVDEAARANPLDLFIPMSMGEKRIILVGDHMQLPHILEPELEQDLISQESLDESLASGLRESLFARLFRQMKALENKDGVNRTVTLDTQYRMHPVLGEFISNQFYDGELKSGLVAEHFDHGLTEYGSKVCGWIDVPNCEGSEFKSGPITTRQCEAKRVADEVARLTHLIPTKSIGVISFYSAQVTEIKKELVEHGICDSNSELEINKNYTTFTDSDGKVHERLRIGTVDAFQGKEFDIVILSMTRSTTHKVDLNSESELNRKFGHLRLVNRMNVAMSRQRSLLIVVGDRAMATSVAAQKAVPALNSFENLCNGEHGFVI